MRLDLLNLAWRRIVAPTEYLEDTPHTMLGERVMRGELTRDLYRVSISWNGQRAVWHVARDNAFEQYTAPEVIRVPSARSYLFLLEKLGAAWAEDKYEHIGYVLNAARAGLPLAPHN